MTDRELSLRIERPEESVPARVVRVVRKAILDGTLPPGTRLTERELGDLTGVSRTSIREAIRHLQNLGLVEPSAARGIRVTVWNSTDVRHIYELRDALESAAAELFVRNASDQQVDELLECVPPAEAGAEERLALIYQFDELLALGAGNPMLQEALSALHARIHALRRLSTSVDGRQAASTQEYAELVDAIRDRSPERAAAAARRHVRAAGEAALIAVERFEGDDPVGALGRAARAGGEQDGPLPGRSRAVEGGISE